MSEEKLVPKLRFIDESDNWNLFKLGEVLDKKGYIRGPFGSALKRGEMKKEGIPVYEQQHAIYNNRIFRYYIDNDKFQELKRFQVFPNDLIVSCSGTIGKTSLITNNDEKGIISQALLILRSNPNIINPKFLKYFLETNNGYNSLISSAGGSSQVNIAKKQIILDIPLLVPNLETQSKIISFLDLINNKIELLEEKHKYYQDFKKYLMQKLFAQELRFDFDEIKLKSISKINKGKQLNKEHMLEIGKFYVLNGGQEPSGYTDSWNTSENTITISEGGNSCGFVNFNTEKFWSGGHCYYLNKLSENIDVYYLYSYLKFIEPQIMRLRVGSGLPNIQKGDIENIKIKILPKKEQIKISNLLLSTDNKISSIESQKDSFEIFKKGLLQQMFV